MTTNISTSARIAVLAGLLAVPFLGSSEASAFDSPAREVLLMDTTTGTVVFEKNADQPMTPASMSKMMTLYMIFQRLRDGRLKLDDTLTVSENAWRKGGAATGGSTMFLKPNEEVKVEDLIRGIVVQSGNDASIVVAEGLSGSEAAFAREMTRKGREIGLRNTTFKNATGWPDPEHVTTARDLATLAYRTIKDFPTYYHYYSEKEFTHNGIRQGNRNPLLYRDSTVDGLKTGHTESAGFGLTASATEGERRLILVVGGLPSMQARADESERILSWGFHEFDNYELFKPGNHVASAEVWLGQTESVPLVTDQALTVTLPRSARAEMKVTASYDGPISAPVQKGDRLGVLKVDAPGVEEVQVPLVAGKSVERLGVVGRVTAGLGHLTGYLAN